MLLSLAATLALAAPGPTDIGDTVDGSVPAFQSSTPQGGPVYVIHHPYCLLTGNAYDNTWTIWRTIWNCAYDGEGNILQFTSTQEVEIHEWCDKDGQLHREEVVLSILPHPSPPEGVPPICHPGTTVLHEEARGPGDQASPPIACFQSNYREAGVALPNRRYSADHCPGDWVPALPFLAAGVAVGAGASRGASMRPILEQRAPSDRRISNPPTPG
jgi:hypothetical protein